MQLVIPSAAIQRTRTQRSQCYPQQNRPSPARLSQIRSNLIQPVKTSLIHPLLNRSKMKRTRDQPQVMEKEEGLQDRVPIAETEVPRYPGVSLRA